MPRKENRKTTISHQQLKRIIIMRLKCIVIEDIRDLPEAIGGYVERRQNNRLEWVLPKERYGFGGHGKSFETARTELIDGIWRKLNGEPVVEGEQNVCELCKRAFVSPYRRTRFCSKECSDAFWHRGGSLETRRKSVERKAQA